MSWNSFLTASEGVKQEADISLKSPFGLISFEGLNKICLGRWILKKSSYEENRNLLNAEDVSLFFRKWW